MLLGPDSDSKQPGQGGTGSLVETGDNDRMKRMLLGAERDMRNTVDRLFEQSTLSLVEVVSQTGLTQECVEAIISGRWLPSPKERKSIADVFQVSVDSVDWGHTMSPRNVRYHRYGLPEDF